MSSRHQELVDEYGDDDAVEGTSLRFYKQFKVDDTLFTYLAVKANSFWYVTGQVRVFSWPDLLEFFEKDNLLGAEALFVADPNEVWIPMYDVEDE